MKLNSTKRFKIIVFAVLFILFTIALFSGKVEAADSINCYVAKKYDGGELEVGKTYYVVETNIDSEVYITDSIIAAAVEAVEPTDENVWGQEEFDERYIFADGSPLYINVRITENRGSFDGCPYGSVISKNDNNLRDKNTNKSLSGSVNEYLYWCDGGGVENLTIFLFTTLDQATISADDIRVEQASEFEEGDIPTEDDFRVIVTVNGEDYVLDSANNTDNPYYVVVDPKGIEEGENTVKILVYDSFEKEITVKPKEEVVETTPEVKKEKDETPKTGTESNIVLVLSIIAMVSFAEICIKRYINVK